MPAMAVRFIKARIEKGYLNVSESHQDNSLQPKLVRMKAITGISMLEIIDRVKFCETLCTQSKSKIQEIKSWVE